MSNAECPNEDAEDYDPPAYARASDIAPSDLRRALCDLPFLSDDMFLRMQAQNISIVDQLLMKLEEDALEHQFRDDHIPPPVLQLLSALTQMWIFSIYEMLRTWRRRLDDIIKWADNGGLAQKLKSYEQKGGYCDFGKQLRAEQLKRVIQEPAIVDKLRVALNVTHVTFTRLDHVRVNLAKHETAKSKGEPAHAPGYARINQWCGALEYELSRGGIAYDVVCRRDIADAVRAIGTAEPQTKEELAAFDAFMRGRRGL